MMACKMTKNSMMRRICGMRMRRCTTHQLAPSMRAASTVSPGTASKAAENTTTPKPSCCQMMTPPMENITQLGLPSQSWIKKRRCIVVRRLSSTPLPWSR